MGLIPAGTGNLLARTIGTPQEVVAATRVALTGDDRKIDVGRVRVDDAEDERVFLVMAGTGFDAAIMANTPEALKVRVGPLAYVHLRVPGHARAAHPGQLTLDDEPPLRRRTRTVVVGNSGTLLGGLVLMPTATIDDGVLDVVNIAPKGARRLARRGRSGDHPAAPRARPGGALAGPVDRHRVRRAAAVPARRRPDRRGDASCGSGSIRRRW